MKLRSKSYHYVYTIGVSNTQFINLLDGKKINFSGNVQYTIMVPWVRYREEFYKFNKTVLLPIRRDTPIYVNGVKRTSKIFLDNKILVLDQTNTNGALDYNFNGRPYSSIPPGLVYNEEIDNLYVVGLKLADRELYLKYMELNI